VSNLDKFGIPHALGDGGAYLAGDGGGGGGLSVDGVQQPQFLRALLENLSSRTWNWQASETTLAAIPSNQRADGMLCFVKGSTVGPSLWYRDEESAASPVAGSVVQASDLSTGRWLILATQAELTGGASAPQKATATIPYTALAAGTTNGGAVSVNIGSLLPANARILSVALRLATPFTGGGATAVSLTVGSSGDLAAIVSAANVLAAAVNGQASTMALGKAPFMDFVTAGAQLLATFTPDGSHTLLALTAGSITVDVLYSVLP
jgi:hypothetical protein